MPGIPLHLGPLSLDLSSEVASCLSASPSCGSDINSTEHMAAPSEVAIEGIYSTNHVLSGENTDMSPTQYQKKENFIRTVWNSISETLARQSTMIFSKISNPLSVTLMNNDIINNSFFKNSLEHETQFTTDKPYEFEIQEKKSLNMMKQIHNTCFKETESFKSFIMDDDKFWACYDDNDHDDDDDYETWTNKNEPIYIEKSMENIGKNENFSYTNQNNNTMESHETCTDEIKESPNTNDFHYVNIDLEESTDSDENEMNEENTTIPHDIGINEDTYKSAVSFCIVSKSDVPPERILMDSIKETSTSACLSNLCQKVWEDMSNPFYYKPTYVDMEEETMEHLRQLPYHYKKINNVVATDKDSDREKFQLRKSGVNQTSHLKPHNSPDFDRNNENFHFEILQNIEDYDTVQNNHSVSNEFNNYNNADGCDIMDVTQMLCNKAPIKQPTESITFNTSDVLFMDDKSLIQKETQQKATNSVIEMSFTLDSLNAEACQSDSSSQDVDSIKSRLLSETSDSEDSFCILFEAESEMESMTDCDETNSNDQDSEDDSIDTINKDDQDGEELSKIQKVKFDLTPIIHVMVKWDYAYRAARKGPWEQMARDNERFQGRINSIAAVLNPILTTQHRSQVWQERFAYQK